MLLHMQVRALMLLQEAGAPGWDFRHLWTQMGGLAKAVVIIMFLMSAWAIGVMIDRVMAFNAARKQSRQFAPAVAGALREGKLDEAIKVADRYKKSHLAKVVVAGLQEFQAHQGSSQISGEEIEASRRALERSEAIVHAELKRGVSALATIGSTAPFVGLFGTVWGIMNAMRRIGALGNVSIDVVAGPIGEALVATGFGIAVAVPAVLAYNFFLRKLKSCTAEFDDFAHDFLNLAQRATYRLDRSVRVSDAKRAHRHDSHHDSHPHELAVVSTKAS